MSTSGAEAVAIARCAGTPAYPDAPPYHPGTAYPEYPFGAARVAPRPNVAYETVRESFRLLGLDAERYGTAAWNPLGSVIRPGDRVVIKPNMVRDYHEIREAGTAALITHGSVLRAVVDYVFLARGGRGSVTIADSPQNDADWDELVRHQALRELVDFYRAVAPEFRVELVEVRREAVRKYRGVVVKRYARPGDPAGYATFDLGPVSEFAAVPERNGKLFGAEYDLSETNEHHGNGAHQYLIGRTFLDADLIINVPKLKTHKKSGITVCIKSAIGISGEKNWLPHHTEGTPEEGGDQFAESSGKRRIEGRLAGAAKRMIFAGGTVGGYIGGWAFSQASRVFGRTNENAVRSGNWYGNDTIWRTVLDLYKCWTYGDREGRLHDTPQRRFFAVVDGIVGGEGNGPLSPTARDAGIVLAGSDPFAVDWAAATVLGFDPLRLKILQMAERTRPLPLARGTGERLRCVSNHPAWNGPWTGVSDWLDFAPHFGWAGYLEREGRRLVAERRGPAA